jgi:hypothetical protein
VLTRRKDVTRNVSFLREGDLNFELIGVQRLAVSGRVDSSVSGTERILPNSLLWWSITDATTGRAWGDMLGKCTTEEE